MFSVSGDFVKAESNGNDFGLITDGEGNTIRSRETLIAHHDRFGLGL